MAQKITHATAKIDVEASGKPNLDQITAALEGMGDEGKQAAQTIRDSFEQVDKRLSSVERAFDGGRLASKKMVSESVTGFDELREKIQQFEKTGVKAPQEVSQALAAMEKRVKSARDTYISKENAIKDTNATLNKAGVTWSGLGNAVEQAAGKFGKAVGVAGAVSLALQQGWQIGTQFAKAIGTDFSEFNRVLDETKSRLGNLVSSLSDATISLFTGQWKDFRKELDLSVKSLTMSGDALKGYKLLLDSGLEGVEQFADHERALVAILEAHNLAMAAGPAAQALWRKALAESGGDAATFAKLLAENVLPKLADMKAAYDNLTTAQGTYKTAIAEEITAIGSLISAIETQKKAREQGLTDLNEATEAAKRLITAQQEARKAIAAQDEQQKNLNTNLAESVGWINKEIDARDKNFGVIAAGAKLIDQELKAGYVNVDTEIQKHLKTLATLGTSFDTLSQAEKHEFIWAAARLRNYLDSNKAASDNAIILDRVKGSITNVTEETRKSTVEFDKATGTIRNVGAEAEVAGGKVTDFAQSVGQSGVTVGQLDTSLNNVLAHLKTMQDSASIAFGQVEADAKKAQAQVDSMTESINRAAEALSKLGEVGSSGGGGGGGWADDAGPASGGGIGGGF